MSHGKSSSLRDSMLLLEQSILKTPVEAMRKVYRAVAKPSDKELASIESSLKRAKNSSSSKREDKLKVVEAALARLRVIQKRMHDSQLIQRAIVESCRTRMAYLQQLNALTSFSTRSYASWANLRLQRQLVDTMLRRGYKRSASRLALSHNLGGLINVEMELFREMGIIESALRRGSATEALIWCKDNASALRKAKSTLDFDLRFQEFIELARSQQQHLAIQHCRKYLITPSHGGAKNGANGAQRMRQAMALLAFGPDTTCPPYKALYNRKRWLVLAATFRRSFMALVHIAPLPLLNVSIWAGLAALKLPTCFSPEASEHNPDCPVCDTRLFGKLAQAPEVPAGQHVHSVIVCRITGKVLAGEDTVYALPNGMVYSGEACEDLASRGKGKVRCPRTGEVFEWKELKKVYIT